jgi:GNAT superfamily N-acetyltransferase
MVVIEKLENHQINYQKMNKKFMLWYDDLEEAGVTDVLVAFSEEGDIVGFQSVNSDNRCVAIEVISEFQNQGIGTALIGHSGCYLPERNENGEFWEKMKVRYSEEYSLS